MLLFFFLMKISKSIFLSVSLLSLGLLYGCGAKDSAIVASPSPVAVVSPSSSPIATPSPSLVISSPKPVILPTSVSSVSESTPAPKSEAPPADKETSGYVSGTCKELRAIGLSDFRPGDPNYSTFRDRDRDGIACESGASTTPEPKVEAATLKPKVEATPAAKEPSSYVAGTCKQLRSMGLSDFRPGDPNYTSSRDRDHDGIACESR